MFSQFWLLKARFKHFDSKYGQRMTLAMLPEDKL